MSHRHADAALRWAQRFRAGTGRSPLDADVLHNGGSARRVPLPEEGSDVDTGAIGPDARAMTLEVMAAFDEVHSAGTTIVMVTHDPACAARAERIVFLRDGRTVDEIRPGDDTTTSGDREGAVVAWLRERGF